MKEEEEIEVNPHAKPVKDQAEEEQEENEERVEVRTRVPLDRPLTKKEIGKRKRQYNAAMEDTLKLLRPTTEFPFIETLLVESKERSVVESIDDDHERELVFTKQALEAAINGCEKLHDLDIPYRRPDDYFAEMVKSDQHMSKITERLGEEKRRAEARETARKQREMRKFGKEVQKEKIKERTEKKQTAIDQVKDWRKKHQKGDEFPIELAEENEDFDGKKKNKKRNRPEEHQQTSRSNGDEDGDEDERGPKKKNKKREEKDKKYKAPKQSGWKRNNMKEDEQRERGGDRGRGEGRSRKQRSFGNTLARSISGDEAKMGKTQKHAHVAGKRRKVNFKNRH